MSSAEEDAAGNKLSMLCLHGFLQTSSVFRSRIGSLRKGLKSRVHFLFQDAPFHAASTLTEEQVARFGGSQEGLTWFQWQDLGPDKRPSLAVKYSNWDAAYAALCDTLRQQAPDGLLGFSQGATATALFLASLLAAQRAGRDTDVPLPKFAIICAGFLPNDPEYATLLRDVRVNIPSLFIIGATDALIPPHRTQALLETFDPAAVEVLHHPGAHYVPTCTGEVKQQLVAFLEKFTPGANGANSNRGAAGVTSSASVGASLDSAEEDANGGEGTGFPEAAAAAATAGPAEGGAAGQQQQ